MVRAGESTEPVGLRIKKIRTGWEVGHAGAERNLKDIMPSNVSQLQKDKYRVSPLIQRT